jgi:ABC-type transporter Mla subunit MlaD
MNKKTTAPEPEEYSPTDQSESADLVAVTPEDQLIAIRDLLHGEEVRRINASIQRLSEDFQARLDALREAAESSLHRLGTELSARSDDLRNHVDMLNKQRIDREAGLSGDIANVEKSLAESQREASQADNELHNELKSEAERLMREMTERHREAMAELKKTAQDLSANKADRKTLATLLATVATNLGADEKK